MDIERRIHFFRVGFYTMSQGVLVSRSEDCTFQNIMDEISSLKFVGRSAQSRYLDLEDGNVIFVNPEKCTEPNVVLGSAIVARRNALPQLEHNGVLSSLNIPPTSGVAEVTHFAYFVKEKVLGVEFNFFGPRPSRIAEYIENKATKVVSGMTLEPILSFDIDQAISLMGEMSVLQVEASTNAANILAQLNRSLGDAFRAASYASQAETVELILRKKKEKKKGLGLVLAWDKLKQVLMTPEQRELLNKLRVHAYDKNETRMRTFDLLEDKMIVNKKVIRLGRSRAVSKDSMFAAIIEAFEELRQQAVVEQVEQRVG